MWSAESVIVSVVEVIHDLGCRRKFLKPLSRSVGLATMVNVQIVLIYLLSVTINIIIFYMSILQLA